MAAKDSKSTSRQESRGFPATDSARADQDSTSYQSPDDLSHGPDVNDPDIIIEPTGEVSRDRDAENAPQLTGEMVLEDDEPPDVNDPDIIIEPTGEVSRDRDAEKAKKVAEQIAKATKAESKTKS